MPDLQLNSLSRYSKKSPRLVLEEYNHCEVPAGCGGAVLRWNNPAESIPIIIRYFSENGTLVRMRFNGQDKQFGKYRISYGKHVLALEIKNFDSHYAVLLLAGWLDEDYTRILKVTGDTKLLSLANGTWKYTIKNPDDNNQKQLTFNNIAWHMLDFDDSDWPSLIEKPLKPDPGYWTKSLLEQGAVPLGIDGNTDSSSVYIRKSFTIQPQEHPDDVR